MPRQRSPERDKAFAIFEEHQGQIANREIANRLGVPEKTIGGWKVKDKWSQRLNGVLQKANRSTAKDDTSVTWAKMEAEYVTDLRKKPCNLRDVAEKYGVRYQTVRVYAAKNEWRAKRHAHATNVVQKTASKAAELVSDDAARAIARHLALSSQMLDVMERAMADPNEFRKVTEKVRQGYGPGEFDEKIEVVVVDALNDARFLNVVNALEKLQKMQRQTLGVLDERDRRKLESSTDDEPGDDGFLEALKGTASDAWAEDDEEENTEDAQ